MAIRHPTIDNSIIFAYTYPNESPSASIVIAKLDSSGNIMQTKTVGAKNSFINDFLFNDRKEPVLLGYTRGLSFEKSNIYLLKSDSNQSFGCYGDTVLKNFAPTNLTSSINATNFIVDSHPSTTSKACSSKPIFDLSYDACKCIPPFADITLYSDSVSNPLCNTSKRGTEFLWNFGNGLTDTSFTPQLPYTKDLKPNKKAQRSK